MLSGRVTTIRCTDESGHVRMITRVGESAAELEACKDADGATGGMVVWRTRQPWKRGPLEMRGRRLRGALLTTFAGVMLGGRAFRYR